MEGRIVIELYSMSFLKQLKTLGLSLLTLLFLFTSRCRFHIWAHIKGIRVIPSVEHVTTGEGDIPTLEVVIADCGEIADDGVINFFKDGHTFPEIGQMTLMRTPTRSRGGLMLLTPLKRLEMNSTRSKTIRWHLESIGRLYATWIFAGKKKTLMKACKLKLGDLKGALFDAEFALREGEANVKALFGQGQAQMALNDADSAVESFKKALELEPNDGGIKKELATATATKKISDRRTQEKKAFSKKFLYLASHRS